ncbi:GNAT family N-acetyltransferase [Streptantibioticus parmotrematis]|uniref:GNAT family N-acetyltransferase n=1 Tax=Streptantibioticus parmotrematis TaxID=2873249 RepID=UPI0033F33466
MTIPTPDIRELHDLDDFADVVALFARIWQCPPEHSPVNVEQMRALSHCGNYVAGAYHQGRLAGASVAFLSAPVGRGLHSHVTGALPGLGAGHALKLHQRAWALERGLDRITWTYDPLVRRNAHFNLVKLGALPEEYLPSFYGPMDDGINTGDETDRALAVWHLLEPRAEAAALGRPQHPDLPAATHYALRDHHGRPRPGTLTGGSLLVQLPADIETLRRTDPAAAKDWRLALRDVLGTLLSDGASVIGFHDKSSYLLTRKPTA